MPRSWSSSLAEYACDAARNRETGAWFAQARPGFHSLVMLAPSNCHPTDPDFVSKGRYQEREHVGSEPVTPGEMDGSASREGVEASTILRPAIDPDVSVPADLVRAEELPPCGSAER